MDIAKRDAILTKIETIRSQLREANEELDAIDEDVYDSLNSYCRSNKGGFLESLEIISIKDEVVTYKWQTSFYGEYDDPVTDSIPIEYCDSYMHVKQYYDMKEQKIKEDEEKQRLINEEKLKKEIEESELKLYERLSKKFGSKE